MTTLLETILQNSFTREDVFRRLGLLKQYSEAVTYRSADSSVSTVEEYFGANEDASDLRAISEWMSSVPHDFQTSFYKQIEAVEQALEKIGNMILYTPVALPDSEQMQVAAVVRTVSSVPVLVEFRVDPVSVGGCCFVWDGRYYDYSLSHYMLGNEKAVISYFDHHD